MTGRAARIVRVGNQTVYASRAKTDSTDMDSLNMKVRCCRKTFCNSEDCVQSAL